VGGLPKKKKEDGDEWLEDGGFYAGLFWDGFTRICVCCISYPNFKKVREYPAKFWNTQSLSSELVLSISKRMPP
jgi:hypothetical protein